MGLLKSWQQEFCPDFVAFFIQVQVVFVKECRVWLSCRVESGGPGVDKDGFGVCFADVADELIGLDALLVDRPAFNAGFDAEEDDTAAVGQVLCGFIKEQLEVLTDDFRRFSCVQVVIAGVEHDGVWVRGDNESFEEVNGVA